NFTWIADRLVLVVPLAGAFVRLGNFFNSEIIGLPTTLPWGVVFERVDGVARHPAQLYEAIAYVIIFLILWSMYQKNSMKLNAAQLQRQLRDGLAPVYVVSGDDPLLCGESADLIRQACRDAGSEERLVFHIDRSFDWAQVREAGNSLSLFAQQRLIELRIPG